MNRFQSHAQTILSTAVKKFNKHVKIDAIITELPPEIITRISCLDRGSGRDQMFMEYERIANDQSSRYKKDVFQLFDELEQFFQQQPTTSNHVVFLFSPRYDEHFHRILM